MSYFNLNWLNEYLGVVKVILDIGSCNGADARLLKEERPNARVIAIEADNNNHKKMVANGQLNGIEIYHCAVCDKDGEITFHPNKGKRWGSGSIHEPAEVIFKFEGMEFDNPYKISSTRLDTFCKVKKIDHIDLIHMDIQGAEYEALLGLGELRPSMMFMEMGGGSINCYKNTTDPTEKLIEMGYTLLEKLPGDQLWRHKDAIR